MATVLTCAIGDGLRYHGELTQCALQTRGGFEAHNIIFPVSYRFAGLVCLRSLC
jgi:hypothetical protein